MTVKPFEITMSVPPPKEAVGTNEYGEVFQGLMQLAEADFGASFFIPCELSKCEALRKNIGVKMTKIRKRGPDYREFFATTAKVVEKIGEEDVQGIRVWKVRSAATAAEPA